MLNQTGVVKTSYGYGEKRLIVDEQNSTSFSCVVSSANVSAVEGKKIIKAGIPLFGSLTARNTPFTVSGAQGAKPVGIALHDVDVTAGTANGQVLVSGFVDISKIDDSTVKSALVSAEANLKLITLVQ
jgi:hypothetical protein